MVEKHRSDIIQMSIECEKASSALVGPDLNLIVVPPRHEQGLRFVEINASYRPIVLLKPINKGAHAIVP